MGAQCRAALCEPRRAEPQERKMDQPPPLAQGALRERVIMSCVQKTIEAQSGVAKKSAWGVERDALEEQGLELAFAQGGLRRGCPN